jgi:conjugal transfer pilus assembly protein TraD
VTRGPSPRADAIDGLAGPMLAAVALVVVAPAAATGTTLAWLIDRRGWRRWPALLAGMGVTAVIATLGGGAAARHALSLLASRANPPAALTAMEVGWIAALQVAVGIAVAPLLLVVIHHRDEHETTRHGRWMSRRRRAETQAERFVARARWPTPPDRTVLGVRLDGAVMGCTTRFRTRALVAVPLADWGRQALIVGETGSGKTVTALTVADEAMRVGWDVYWVDGKADPDVAARFLTLARRRGLQPVDGSDQPIDGWRGSAESIVNRLLATQRFTEPYYAGIARNVLKWAVTRPGPPRSFAELVARMDQRGLRRAWRESPDEADKIRAMLAADFLGARYRYEGVAWAVGATLDGDWSYEDVRAAYVPVGRPEHRDQAEEVGAFLLEDLLHWAMARKPPSRRALVVVDEFSKLAARPDAAVELVERVRSFGVGVALIGQTWASLGRTDSVRERLAGTVGTVVVHQLKQPDRLVELAGTRWAMERTEQLVGQTPTGRATQRPGYRPVVEPDDVRALRTGEAFVIRGGEAVKVRIRAGDAAPGPTHATR